MIAATPEQIRQITDDVLARPEFSDKPTWTQLLTDQFLHGLDSLAKWSARNPDAAKLLTIVLTVVLVLLIVHIVYTVIREFIGLRKPGSAAAHRQRLSPLEGVAQNWTEAIQLARVALDAGDLYRALWITHRVLLSVLDRNGRIKFVRWKTNSDYLRECRDAGPVGTILSELTAAYERVIYAHTEFDRQQAVNLLGQVEALAAEAGP